jgi:hypothetical protein
MENNKREIHFFNILIPEALSIEIATQTNEYARKHIEATLNFPCFLFKFYVIFTKFLKMSGTWKYFIKFSYLVELNFISIIDRWNNLSLYQYMFRDCRTPMTNYKLEKPGFPLHWLGTKWKWRVSRLRSPQYWGSRGKIYSAISCAEWFWLWHRIFRDGIIGQRGNWQQWWYCSRRHC